MGDIVKVILIGAVTYLFDKAMDEGYTASVKTPIGELALSSPKSCDDDED